MLVEEAAEVLEITLLAVLPPSAKHLVMIGDHYRLPPKVEVYALRTNHHFDFSAGQALGSLYVIDKKRPLYLKCTLA